MSPYFSKCHIVANHMSLLNYDVLKSKIFFVPDLCYHYRKSVVGHWSWSSGTCT